MTIQGPSCDFVTATMIKTIAVTVAPKPLIAALERQPGVLNDRQWITMPACESVNDTNTPIM